MAAVPPEAVVVMPRIPRGWRAAFHPQGAGRGGSTFAWRPGPSSGMHPMQRTPVQRYGGKLSGVTLTGGQAQGVAPGSGAVTLRVGPAGRGNVGCPAQATIARATGPVDSSTGLPYLGLGGVPAQQVATAFSGTGTIALGVPGMQQGQTLTVSWSGGHPGDTVAVNMIGTMDALTTG